MRISKFLSIVWCGICIKFISYANGQSTLPKLQILKEGCTYDEVLNCKTNCSPQYRDNQRKLCPCYSKMFECLVLAGCQWTERMSVMFECTRDGYCKDGYCTYRAGDKTPGRRENRNILVDVITPVVNRPCIGGTCCSHGCKSKKDLEAQTQRSNDYRNFEISLVFSSSGDPRLGVNQNFDGMPYSINLEDIPET